MAFHGINRMANRIADVSFSYHAQSRNEHTHYLIFDFEKHEFESVISTLIMIAIC